METIILLAFACLVLFFSLTGRSTIYALLIGFMMFATFACYQKHSPKEILKTSLQGLYKVRNIIILFFLIGSLTASWRAAATIPTIIYDTSSWLHPKFMLLMCFLLNCGMSFLTGSSFGTVATLGTITMGIANTMGINPLFSGGAILSGIFFGDRCSAVSTSAMLVSELTGTELYTNIRNMIHSAFVPFVMTSLLYLLLGLTGSGNASASTQMTADFPIWYHIHWVNLLPAIIILVCSVCKVSVKLTLLFSILCGCILSIVVQGVPAGELLQFLVSGYRASNEQAGALFNGGGITSMLRVMAIVSISSTYSGLFAMTGLLRPVAEVIRRIAKKASKFTATLTASCLSALISCNQSLSILLTEDLCKSFQEDKYELACDMEDSVVLIAALVPWSIAGAVPVAALGAPVSCLFFAFYLYLVPLYRMVKSLLFRQAGAALTQSAQP